MEKWRSAAPIDSDLSLFGNATSSGAGASAGRTQGDCRTEARRSQGAALNQRELGIVRSSSQAQDLPRENGTRRQGLADEREGARECARGLAMVVIITVIGWCGWFRSDHLPPPFPRHGEGGRREKPEVAAKLGITALTASASVQEEQGKQRRPSIVRSSWARARVKA